MKKLIILLATVLFAACDSDSKCDPGPGNEVSFDGNVSWTDEKEQGDGGDVLFRIFSPDEISVAVCGEGRVVKENQNWVLRGGNEIEVCVACPVDKNFIGMEVGGVYEFLGEWDYESNLAKGRFRLRGDVTLTPEYAEIEAPQPGDYYYADGTWSSELNSSKVCIGIVFAAGRSEHDTQEYAELAGEVRGYVVAVRNADPAKQRYSFGRYGVVDISGFDDDIETFCGYTRTRAMERQPGFSEADYWACWSAVHHIQAAPGTSSGWYVPAFGEMNVLCGVYHETVRERITRIEYGEDMADDGKGLEQYWAMGKLADSNSFVHVDFRDSQPFETFADRLKTSPMFAYCRPILTF
ncbi:hypothetical protein [uncultured Alistipes sp.]|jgi:hypothetical protein|uniref:hypothetical protein n=1 Tax=Alistipes sp. TaxID=1872444 RepID=UPI00266DA689|nr:hypothetical protein [uncultured Alistipes sp.]